MMTAPTMMIKTKNKWNSTAALHISAFSIQDSTFDIDMFLFLSSVGIEETSIGADSALKFKSNSSDKPTEV